MRICERCQVSVAGSAQRCPLCGHNLAKKEESSAFSGVDYPQFHPVVHKTSLKTKVTRFMTLSVVLILLIVNFATFLASPDFWALVPIESITFVWLSARNWPKFIHFSAKAILWQLCLTCILILSIDLVGRFDHWSLNYILPSLTIGATAWLLGLMKHRGAQRAEYFAALFVLLAVNLLPLLFYPLRWTTVLWPGVSALSVSLLTILGLLVFARGDLIGELRKRLHF